MASQLSIFVENQPGKLEKITKALADSGINIRGISVASAGEFGIVKVLVSDPARAALVLKEQHFTVTPRAIIVALIEDRPGGLHGLLMTLSAEGMNVEDCYGIVLEDRKTAAVVMEVEKYPEARDVLARHGVRTLRDEEIYRI